jgi:hypothetical protein
LATAASAQISLTAEEAEAVLATVPDDGADDFDLDVTAERLQDIKDELVQIYLVHRYGNDHSLHSFPSKSFNIMF